MAVLQSSEETDTHRIILWYGTEVGDVVENPNGVHHPHETRVISGKCRVDYFNFEVKEEEIEEDEVIMPGVNDDREPKKVRRVVRTENRIRSDRESVDLSEGGSIELPLNTPYTVTATEVPLEIQCHYPLGEAAEEVTHLRKEREHPTIWHLQREFVAEKFSPAANKLIEGR